MNKLKSWILLVSLVISFHGQATPEAVVEGSVELAAEGPEVATTPEGCVARLFGTTQCPIVPLSSPQRDDDIFLSFPSSIAEISFEGRAGVVSSCTCESPADVNIAEWSCDCPIPADGAGTFEYQTSCKSSVSSEIREIKSKPTLYSFDCPGY